MAQAFRSRKSAGKVDGDLLCIGGTYNQDHKVVVEWEMDLTEDDLVELLEELPAGQLTFDLVRLTASSWCQMREGGLTALRVTHYRINRNSVVSIIAWAEARGMLVEADPGEGLQSRAVWSRP